MWLGDPCALCLCKPGLLSQMAELHFEHTGLETSAAGMRQGVRYRQHRAKASGLPPYWVDGFIELPVTRQRAAAHAVTRPEDKVLFNNCLTIIEVLWTLQACKENRTCPEITLHLYASPLLQLFSGEQLTAAYLVRFAVGNFACEEELTLG